MLPQRYPEEIHHFIEGNYIHFVAQVGVYCSWDNQKFLIFRIRIALHHSGLGIPAEVAGVSFPAMNHQYCRADLVAVPEDGLVHKRHDAGYIPAAIGVQRTGVIAALCLVVVMVIFYIEGSVFRYICRHTTAKSIGTILVVTDPLGVEDLFLLVPGSLTVLCVKIAIGVHAGHIVHGGSTSGLNSGVQRCRVQGHAAPAANADDPDFFRVCIFPQGEIIHRCLETFRIDIR